MSKSAGRMFSALNAVNHFSPLLAVMLPNIFFGIVGIYLLQKAKR